MSSSAGAIRRLLKAPTAQRVPGDIAEAPAWHRVAACLAVAGLYAIAIGMGGFKALQNTGSLLLFVGSLPFLPRMIAGLRGQVATWLVLGFLAYVLVHTLVIASAPNPVDVEHWYQARRISRVLLIPVAAWWIAARAGRDRHVLALVLVGLLAGMVEAWIDWGGVARMFGTARVKFQLNEIRMGQMSGVALVGLVLFASPIIHWGRGVWGRRSMALLWLAAVCMMAQAFIVSQSRGAYLTFLVLGIGFAVVWLVRMRYRAGAGPFRAGRLPVAIAVLLLTLFVSLQWDAVTRKFAKESEVITSAIAGDWEAPEPTSVGMRLYLYQWGINAFTERPWFGWGADGPMQVIHYTGKPHLPLNFNHFHNEYIDLAVRFGIVGCVLFAGLLAALVQAGFRSQSEGRMSPRLFWFLVFVILVHAVGSLSFSFLESSHGWFMLILLGGMLWGPALTEWPSGEAGDDVAREPAA